MDVLESFSKLKKKLKRSGSKRDKDRRGVESDGKKFDSASLLSQPVSVATADGHNRGEGKADAGGRQIRSTDRLQPPDTSESARGHGSGEGEVWSGIGGGEVSQRYLDPDVKVAVGSGPVREGDEEKAGPRVYPSPSASIPRSGKPDSTWAQPF